ncbi:uncharacterized protein LOC131031182 [Cryptomeria japonica]|uniref:uncharacterized protein LOC131031182 n=1 Tax=Cryptomeria japonica TaxID=3369 RepID=UPI0027DA1156|nr:uncharacterized protein LOC131031182 [Cryptomeria japonica]
MTPSEAQKDCIMQLNALDELRKMVFSHIKITQHQHAKWHDKYIERKFKSGDWALLYDSRYKDSMGKLQTRWLGAYEIVEVFENRAVRLATIDLVRFKLLVNGHRIRLYHKTSTKQDFLQQFDNQVKTTVPAASAGGLLDPES